MRAASLLAIILSAWVCVSAQAAPPSEQEKAAVERGKHVLVSTLDRSLPKVTLETFLKRAAGNAPVRWEADDCGEQTGNPAVDRGRDFPICASASLALQDGKTVNVSVAVGTVSKGVAGKPELAYVTITDRNGTIHNARLSDLQAPTSR